MSAEASPAQAPIPTIRIWKIGSPYGGRLPSKAIAPELRRFAEQLGFAPDVQVFSANEFPRAFLNAFVTHAAPEIVASNNHLPIDAVWDDVAAYQQFQSVSEALASLGAFVYLIRSAPHHDGAVELALRAPECPRTRANNQLGREPLHSELHDLSIAAARAYLEGDTAVIERVSDPARLGQGKLLNEAAQIEQATCCALYGNHNLAFASVLVSFRAERRIGSMSILAAWRKLSGEWRLLTITNDPLAIEALDNDIPKLARLLRGRGSADTPAAAMLLEPDDGMYPSPASGERFGDFVWQPSADRGVVAEIAEFEYKEATRLFGVFGDERGRLSAGMLWTTDDIWHWRIWSITTDGSLALSDARTFRH